MKVTLSGNEKKKRAKKKKRREVIRRRRDRRVKDNSEQAEERKGLKKHVEAERRLNEQKPERSGTKDQKQRFVYSEWTR